MDNVYEVNVITKDQLNVQMPLTQFKAISSNVSERKEQQVWIW